MTEYPLRKSFVLNRTDEVTEICSRFTRRGCYDRRQDSHTGDKEI